MTQETATQTVQVTSTGLAFDLTELKIPSLNIRDDLKPGRMPVGLAILSDPDHPDAHFLQEFIKDLPLPYTDDDHVVKAEVDANGISRRCWGVELCKSKEGDQLVLHVGTHFHPATQNGYSVEVGKLKGRLSFEQRRTIADEPYTACKLKLTSKRTRISYTVFVLSERELKDAQGSSIKDPMAIVESELNLLEEGGTFDILPYLSIPKEPPMLMGKLGVGEFAVVEVSKPTPKESTSKGGRKFTWNSFTLTVRVPGMGQAGVFSEGAVSDYLNSLLPKELDLSTPWKLVIKQVEYKEGKPTEDNEKPEPIPVARAVLKKGVPLNLKPDTRN